MSHHPGTPPTTQYRLRTALASIAALSALGLTACGADRTTAGPSSRSTVTATTPASPSTSDAPSAGPTDAEPTSATGAAGFDTPSFQAAMAAIGVPADGPNSGRGTTGVGAMSYAFAGSGQGVGSITCTVSAVGADVTQSDKDALILARTFLKACATWNYQGAAKGESAQFVESTLSTLEPEQPVVKTIGAVELLLGKQAPGLYFLTMRQ